MAYLWSELTAHCLTNMDLSFFPDSRAIQPIYLNCLLATEHGYYFCIIFLTTSDDDVASLESVFKTSFKCHKQN